MSDYLHAWSNEDDELFIEVEDEPDRDVAGQRYAIQTGLVLTYVYRTEIRTQDCECVPTSDACPDDDGKPCVVREGVDVWVFQGWDTYFDGMAADLADERADRLAQGKPWALYLPAGVADPFADPAEPQPIPVAPGQVEAGL